jgi:aryl-alcohol dehydrogenase-like predicted oxidoreductase
MDYRKLGRTGLKVSALCLGTMTFRWTSSEQESCEVLDHAWEAGINFIDTADVYSRWAPGNSGGVAERIIGSWLRGKPREQIVIATKVRGRMWEGPNGEGLSRGHIMKAVDDSLKRLQTDYIDLYQTHAPDWDTPQEETLRALDDLVASGKVRYIGASNHAAWLLMKALWISDQNGFVRYETIQPHYNLIHRGDVEPDLAALCIDQGIGMIPYSPLAAGFLTGKYARDQKPDEARLVQQNRSRQYDLYATEQNFAVIDALREMGAARGKTVTQMALGWMLTQPFVTAPIVGANTVTQLEESLGAADVRLSEDEMTRLDELTGLDRNWFRK